jgi:hypothetical protein
MATTEHTIGITPDLRAELREAADKASRGVRDPKEARKAAAEVDRLREENRRRFGDQAFGVSIIREFRGPLPE